MRLLFLMLLISLGCLAKGQDTSRVMFYNLLNFPTGGSPVTNREDTLRKLIDYIDPDVLMVCELVNSTGASQILNTSLAGGTWASAAFVSNQSTSNSLQNLLFYNSQKFTFHHQEEILTDLRDINKYVLYANDPNLASHQDTTFLDFYVTHLKAGSASSDRNRRDIEATALRNHLDAQTGVRNSIFGADLNVSASTEAAYQTLSSGTYPLQDPINRPGTWRLNASFADIHTQCTRLVSIGDGSSSGMDDRLDHIIVSSPVMSGAQRVRYLPGTYQAFGNDGLHFDLGLLDPPAHPTIPASIMSSLFYMSDHLPVVMDIEITLPLVLPYRFLFLDAEQKSQAVQLHLGLDELQGGEKLVWQRSPDGKTYREIHSSQTLPGLGSYPYLDESPLPGLNYYRVQVTDLNGEISYSPRVQVDYRSGKDWQVQALPDQKIRIYDLGEQGFSGRVLITDLSGKEVYRLPFQCQGPSAEIHLHSARLASGLYLLHLHNADGSSRSLRYRIP